MYKNLLSFWLLLDFCWGASISNAHVEFVQNAEMARTCHDLVYYPKYLDQIIEPIRSCLNFTEDNRIVLPDGEAEGEESETVEEEVAVVLTDDDSDSGLTVLETLQQLVKYIYLEFHIHRLDTEQENQMYRCSWVKLELVNGDGKVNKTTYKALFSNETEPLSSELLKKLEACPDNITVPEFRLCMESACINYLRNSWFTPVVDTTTTEAATTATTEAATTATTETTPLPTITTIDSNNTTEITVEETTVTQFNETTAMPNNETTAVPNDETTAMPNDETIENQTTTFDESETLPDALLLDSQTEGVTEMPYLLTTLAQLQTKTETPTIHQSQGSDMLLDQKPILSQGKEVPDKESTILSGQKSRLATMEEVTELPVTISDQGTAMLPNNSTTAVPMEQATEEPVTISDQEITLFPVQETRVMTVDAATEMSVAPSRNVTVIPDQQTTKPTETPNPKTVFASTTQGIADQTSADQVTANNEDMYR